MTVTITIKETRNPEKLRIEVDPPFPEGIMDQVVDGEAPKVMDFSQWTAAWMMYSLTLLKKDPVAR